MSGDEFEEELGGDEKMDNFTEPKKGGNNNKRKTNDNESADLTNLRESDGALYDLLSEAIGVDFESPLFNVSIHKGLALLTESRGLLLLKNDEPEIHKALRQFKSLHSADIRTQKTWKTLVRSWLRQIQLDNGAKTTLPIPRDVKTFFTVKDKVTEADQLYHMDLAEMAKLNTDKKKYRYPYLLVFVDVYSNYVFLEPVRHKNALDTSRAIEKILEKIEKMRDAMQRHSRSVGQGKAEDDSIPPHLPDSKVRRIQSDKGGEFLNEKVGKVLEQYDIRLFTTTTPRKAYVAESKIGQMKRLLSLAVGQNAKKIMDKINESHGIRTKQPIKSKLTKAQLNRVEFNLDDWTNMLDLVAKKLNGMENQRNGFSPSQLFLNASNNTPGNRAIKRILKNEKEFKRLRTEREWNRGRERNTDVGTKFGKKILAVGTYVYASQMRLATRTTKQAFAKRSLGEETWELDRLFRIVRRVNDTQMNSIKGYFLEEINQDTMRSIGQMQNVFYRNELIVAN